MANTFIFDLLKSPSSGPTSYCRRGTLKIIRDAGRTVTMQTPTCLAYTVRGTVPHLTLDNLRQLPFEAMQITLEHFFEELNPSSLKYTHGLHKYLGMDDYALFCDVRDPGTLLRSSFNTDKFVSVSTRSGVRQITPSIYIDAMTRYRPDICASLADLVSDLNPSRKRVKKSVDRTTNWLDDCLKIKKEGINLFGVVVGSDHKEERERSAREVGKMDVSGFVMSVLGLGKTPQDRAEFLRASIKPLPQEKPRLAYGVGAPEDILYAVEQGVDLFDSSYTLSNTNSGYATTFKFFPSPDETLKPSAHKINLLNTKYREDFSPLQNSCTCFACKNHTRAYVHHLLVAHEMLATVLLMGHNLFQYYKLFADIRHSIEVGTFTTDRERFLATYYDPTVEVDALEAMPVVSYSGNESMGLEVDEKDMPLEGSPATKKAKVK